MKRLVFMLVMIVAPIALGQDRSNNATAPSSPSPTDVRVVTPSLPDDVLACRRELPEERPPLRGWRAPILGFIAQKWPFDEPDASAPPEIRKAADMVARQLARDGLLATLAQVIEVLGPSEFGNDATADEDMLRRVGLPVDLLPYFKLPGVTPNDSNVTIRHLAQRITAGLTGPLRAEIAAAKFEFKKSHADFRVATESGEEDIGLVRVQLAKGEYWHGIGDGGALDIIRQLTAALPEAKFLISTQQGQTTPLIGLMRLWPHFRPEQVTVIAEPLAIGQWAQDNGKAGVIESAGRRQIGTLAPRYASRGDDGTTFVPGESFMADGWVAAGHTVIQSPLIFQGGNLLAVRDPKTGASILLIGEAEVYRNIALGLTREQTLEAFRIEMGVDRCVVLPAVSYHLDYEVTVRTAGDGVVAFVNDSSAAAKSILEIGLDALKEAGQLTNEDVLFIRESFAQGHVRRVIERLDQKVFIGARQRGQFPESLTRIFSKSLVDSGAGNFQRFLLALDLLMAEAADALAPDPNLAEYLAAIRRRNEDRRLLHQQLVELGWRVAPIPSLAEAERGINYLNGVHAKGLYLMPAYGGIFARLDAAVARAFQDILGPDIRVVPILSAESQRRNGAIHCAASVYPRVE
ncbi:MAG TPA: hypothetical protein VJZ71_12970 [Phycisphaerae bacterium]|nr:hypothetical protein [Phycisphaerae bacterium]